MQNKSAIPEPTGQISGVQSPGEDSAKDVWSDFTPLTPEQARKLREGRPPVSPWRVLGWQAMVGAAVSLLTWLMTGRGNVAASVLYGVVAVVVPGAVFARGLSSRLTRRNAGSAVAGFLLWEMVKIALTIAMLFAASRVVQDVSWPALLLGLVLTMKMYWLGLRVRPKN